MLEVDSVEDTGVLFDNEQYIIDGSLENVSFYNIAVPGAEQFKYLGIVLDRFGTAAAHLHQRVKNTKVAAGMLSSGLARIPAASHRFICYLYQSLVDPVLNNGFEVFVLGDDDHRALQREQNSIWRRLLH
eukprot:9289373-Karenia_brevis.AAC.1